MVRLWQIGCLVSIALVQPALAGPPYLSDDPEPTEYKHFEIYTFNNGTTARDGTSGEAGIDFNYGAAPNLQLTATLPTGFDHPLRQNQLRFGQYRACREVSLLASRHLRFGCKLFSPSVFTQRLACSRG